jgi:hypothetical protein
MSTKLGVHILKCWPEFLDAISDGRKTFELRRDDRDYLVGDTLELREYDPATDQFLARSCVVFVTYVMRAGRPAYPLDDRATEGLREGYVIMGITLPLNHGWPVYEPARLFASRGASEVGDP